MVPDSVSSTSPLLQSLSGSFQCVIEDGGFPVYNVPPVSLEASGQKGDASLAAEPPKTSATTLTMNIVTVNLGAGILSLPWAAAGASLIGATLITILVLALNASTSMIIVLAGHRKGVYDLCALMGKLPGVWGRLARPACDLCIWGSVFLCLISYLIVVADSTEQFFPSVDRFWRVCMGASIALPLCFLSQSQLAISSGLCIAANIYLFVFLAVTSWQQPWQGKACLLGHGPGVITMISALMQAAIVQMCVLPMYEQLERRSPRRFAKCLFISLIFVTALLVLFTWLAYLTFGPSVDSNVMHDLPKDFFGGIARLGMVVAMLSVYPILMISMVAPVRHAEEKSIASGQSLVLWSPKQSPRSPAESPEAVPTFSLFSPPPSPELAPKTLLAVPSEARRSSWWAHLRASHAVTTLVVVCSTVGALAVRNLGTINAVNGAFQVAGMVALCPSLAGIFLLGWRSWLWRALMVLLLLVGSVASILGLAFTANSAKELTRNCIWFAS